MTQKKDKAAEAEALLRAAFKALEQQPAPKSLTDHIDALTGAKTERPDRRN